MSQTILDGIAARLALDLIASDEMADLGIELLQVGIDSPTLRQLAGLNAGEEDSAGLLLFKALQELSVAIPTPRNAALQLSRKAAASILSGEVSAERGAKEIWRIARRIPAERIAELDPFVYAASEWDERPDARREFEKGVLETARDLVRGEGP